jgi:hypothetical protein
MWVKTMQGFLLNMAQVKFFEVTNSGSWEIRAAIEGGGSLVVGSGYSSESAAKARLAEFFVFDLNA